MENCLVLDRIAIGQRLKALRTELGFAQSEMGEYLGMSWRTYQTYEVGSRLPRLETAFLLADKLKVNLDWLMTGNGTRQTIDQARQSAIDISLTTYHEMREKNAILPPHVFQLIVQKASAKGTQEGSVTAKDIETFIELAIAR